MHRTVRFIYGSLALLAVVIGSNQPAGSAPRPRAIELSPLGAYRSGLFDEGAVEIAAYDPRSRRAYLTFAARPKVDVVDLSDPLNPVLAATIDLTPWGADAHATSVSVHKGVLAVAVPQGEDDTAPGRALFFDAFGALLSDVAVGALPDMITFTPNGRMVLTANEGQPNNDYTFDPEGSVSAIDVRRGAVALSNADVTTIGFSAFNGTTLDPSIRIFGPGATVAQDLEPEYITVSGDSRIAWVTLQENNAIAVIDLKEKRVKILAGLGFKDHSQTGRGLDGGRDDGANRIATWPVRGMYQPDAIANFKHKNLTFLVTANEGDVREYDGLNDAGEESVEIEDIALDPVAFPNAATLKSRPNGIGRLKVTRFDGDTDGDGDHDVLYSFGARSFSIWSEDGRLVFDSGDALEQITAAAYPANFNASNANNTRDDRSDDKGPEPEGVTVARLFGRPYLFVMLERIGGVVVYDLTDPGAPRFVQYINTRDFSASPNTAAAGDLGPEAARVIDAEASPTGTPLLLVSNEVSGSLRLFEIRRAP
jgi:hypothetical protein